MNQEASESVQNNQQNKKNEHNNFQDDLTLRQVTEIMRKFVDERNWHRFHTPRNLLLAMTGQVGELAQIFQWKDQVKPGLEGFSERQKIHVGEEISDVLSYLIRLADVCGVDITKAFQDKITKNKKKYPTSEYNGDQDEFNRHMDRKLSMRKQKKEEESREERAQEMDMIKRE